MPEISMSDAAVLVHIVQALSGPLDDVTYVRVLREARYVLPNLKNALEKSGINMDELESMLPEVPLLTPGSKHNP